VRGEAEAAPRVVQRAAGIGVERIREGCQSPDGAREGPPNLVPDLLAAGANGAGISVASLGIARDDHRFELTMAAH
jgi:hypothetical protein